MTEQLAFRRTQATAGYSTLIVLWDGGVSMEHKTLAAAFLVANFPHVLIRTGWHNETIFIQQSRWGESSCLVSMLFFFVLPFCVLGGYLILFV